MGCVFFEILPQICPTPADAHHDALSAGLAYQPHKELDGSFFARLMQMVEFGFCIAALSAAGGLGLVSWC